MLSYNPYILVPLAAWAIAQITKFTLAALRGKLDFRYLYSSGGMPSVHSAVVCSLATTALLVDGAASHLFGFTAIFAVVVMYDSFGVRRSTGEQAVAINMLMDSLQRNRVRLDQPGMRLREILGHQPREVIVGAVLGVVLGAVLNYDKLGPLTSFLEIDPPQREIWVYLAAFILILVGGIAVAIGLRMWRKKSPAIRRLTTRIITLTQTIGWVGLLSVVLVYERANYFGWRMWPIFVLAIGVAWAAFIASSSRTLPDALAEESRGAKKHKGFNWGKRKSQRKT